MDSTKSLSKLSVFLIPFCIFSTIAYPSSVYVITDHRDSDLSAYKITGDQINYQTQMDPPLHFDYGAVGLALDPCSSTLFTSYDGANKIGIINAKILETIKSIDIPVDFAGLVFDTKNQRLLASQRGTDQLYVYLWNPITKTLVLDDVTPETLSNLEGYGAYGIALDETERILYVTDKTKTVKYYDADDPDFGYLGPIDITVSGNDRPAVGIDFYRDQQGNKFLYTGAWSHDVTHNYLVQTNMTDANNPVSVERLIGASATGISVCQYTGYVYVTTSNNHIEVYNNAIFPSDPCDTETSDIDGPADIIVSGDVLYKPPAFYFEKVDVNEPNCVLPGDYITYRITYGPNGIDHNNVVITDYLPCQVDYINLLDPNYDDANRTYKWQIGSLDANDPNDSVTLTVCVNLGAEPNGIITNYCEIESDQYYSFASADTSACFWSPDIIYVDVNAVGCNSGLSWEHADPDLRSAFQKAQAWDVNQIWVAKGTYKPTMTNVRSISFDLPSNVAIYGGFPPGGGTWGERNPDVYDTTLSGDIGMSDYWYDNSYHVVKAVDVNNAVLNGFTITDGHANATGFGNPRSKTSYALCDSS